MLEVSGIAIYLVAGLFIARKFASAIYWGGTSNGWGDFCTAVVISVVVSSFWGVWIVPRLIYLACDGQSDKLAKVMFGEPEEVKQRRQLQAKVNAASIASSTDLALMKLDEMVIEDDHTY